MLQIDEADIDALYQALVEDIKACQKGEDTEKHE